MLEKITVSLRIIEHERPFDGGDLLRLVRARNGAWAADSAEAPRPLPLVRLELRECAEALPVYLVAQIRDILGDRLSCTSREELP